MKRLLILPLCLLLLYCSANSQTEIETASDQNNATNNINEVGVSSPSEISFTLKIIETYGEPTLICNHSRQKVAKIEVLAITKRGRTIINMIKPKDQLLMEFYPDISNITANTTMSVKAEEKLCQNGKTYYKIASFTVTE